jgi:hypothetical protein
LWLAFTPPLNANSPNTLLVNDCKTMTLCTAWIRQINNVE